MTAGDALPPLSTDSKRLAQIAIAEDGESDVTSESLALDCEAEGSVRMREAGVVAGLPYADAVCDFLDVHASWHVKDGDVLEAGRTVGVLQGPLMAVLRAERPLLNLIQRASGVATATSAFVRVLAGTSCRVLHTRKTTPGLRGLEVRAVVAGGGYRHRLGLDTQVMIKDNHWQVLARDGGLLAKALEDARARGVLDLYVEVEDATQVRQAIDAGATRLLVDNQPVDAFRTLAALARQLDAAIAIEATGGLTLANVRAYADAGADYVSVGALTHSVTSIDIGVDITVN